MEMPSPCYTMCNFWWKFLFLVLFISPIRGRNGISRLTPIGFNRIWGKDWIFHVWRMFCKTNHKSNLDLPDILHLLTNALNCHDFKILHAVSTKINTRPSESEMDFMGIPHTHKKIKNKSVRSPRKSTQDP